jgi:hypothetical protein
MQSTSVADTRMQGARDERAKRKRGGITDAYRENRHPYLLLTDKIQAFLSRADPLLDARFTLATDPVPEEIHATDETPATVASLRTPCGWLPLNVRTSFSDDGVRRNVWPRPKGTVRDPRQ